MERHVLRPKYGYDFLYEWKMLEPLGVPEYIARQHSGALAQTELELKNLIRVIVFSGGEFRRVFEITTKSFDINKLNLRGSIKNKRLSERMCILTMDEYKKIIHSPYAEMSFPLNLGKYQTEYAKVIIFGNKGNEDEVVT